MTNKKNTTDKYLSNNTKKLCNFQRHNCIIQVVVTGVNKTLIIITLYLQTIPPLAKTNGLKHNGSTCLQVNHILDKEIIPSAHEQRQPPSCHRLQGFQRSECNTTSHPRLRSAHRPTAGLAVRGVGFLVDFSITHGWHRTPWMGSLCMGLCFSSRPTKSLAPGLTSAWAGNVYSTYRHTCKLVLGFRRGKGGAGGYAESR